MEVPSDINIHPYRSRQTKHAAFPPNHSPFTALAKHEKIQNIKKDEVRHTWKPALAGAAGAAKEAEDGALRLATVRKGLACARHVRSVTRSY